MSFYVYYGKLETELVVAVLPNGTIEHADPIYLYTNKKFSSLKAKDVSVTEDGEDLIAFNDGYYTYQAVSKKAYKELDLTIKSGDAKTSKVTLLRQYDQPITAIPLSDPPRIWTGAIDFHKWAKNESFFAIAPKGLGNGKPIVALWQWSVDQDGVKKTLSRATAQQQSEAASPTTFSFKQNGYYDLNCKINASTGGLNVTIKSQSNADAVLKELSLSAKVEIGAEHTFAPPRSIQQKISLDCSLPRAVPSLPRITGALPFPADLLETLSYSAAFVDQAGYLAKYAVKQFDQLDRSFHQLEKKAEARSAKIVVLEAEVITLGEKNRALTGENKELQRQRDEYRSAAEKRQAELEKRLKDTQESLARSKANAKRLEAENRQLETYIDKDRLADLKRQKEWVEHDEKHRKHEAEDHKIIDGLQKDLEESRANGKKLQKTLDDKNKRIASLEALLASVRLELGNALAVICGLKAELAVEKEHREDFQNKLNDERLLRKRVESKLKAATEKIAEKDALLKSQAVDLEDQKKASDETEQAHDAVKKVRDVKIRELALLRTQTDTIIEDLRTRLSKLEEHDDDHHRSAKNIHGTQNVIAPKSNVLVTSTEIHA